VSLLVVAKLTVLTPRPQLTQHTQPHGMCYSHFGNEVCNGAISIPQWGFINDRYKVNKANGETFW